MEPALHRHLPDDREVLRLAPLLFELLAAVPLSYYLLSLLLVLSVALYNFLEFHVLADFARGWRGDKVRLTYNHASEFCQYVVSKCRILHGRYLATPWLANPHFQTAFLNFFGNPPAFRYRRHIFHTPDGGTVALDWLLSSDVLGSSSNTKMSLSKEDTTPIVVVIPGLTSDSTSSYVKHIVYKIAKRGWNVVVMNHRGLGGISITSDCFYNAGWTEDLRIVINHLYQHHPSSPLFAIGTSIGANVLVKYLGEEGENTPIAGASSVCSPWDLVVCDRFISRRLVQRFYDRVLAIGLKGYAQLHQPVLSRLADWEGIRKSRSVRDFDNYATCIVAKYETVDTYYRRCSSASFVGNVSVPLLCISALDDPVCTKEAIPWDECRANKNIILATTTHGGHLAFFQGISARKLWWVGAVDEFLSVLHSSPHMHKKKRQVAGLHSSLESTIDKCPYVNVLEDGMLTAVLNDELDFENLGGSSGDKSADEQKAIGVDVETERQTANVPPAPPQEIFQEQPEQEAPKDSGMVSVAESISPVKKALNQLSRYSSQSFWLLAYIAIVTTWPLLGPALRMFFNKKLKKMRKTT